jgi:multimeric flavodoxin WrbA
MECKGKSEICVLQDELKEVLSEFKSADIIVLASPIFFGDISAQMKGFIDRTYSYLTPDYKSRLLPGKKMVMILAQGDPDKKHFADVFPRYNEFFKWHDIKENHLIRAFYSLDRKATPLDDAYREAEEVATKINR